MVANQGCGSRASRSLPYGQVFGLQPHVTRSTLPVCFGLVPSAEEWRQIADVKRYIDQLQQCAGSELDIRFADADWHLGDLTHWPLDGYRTYISDSEMLTVGSLKHAQKVEDVALLGGLPLTIAVSVMNLAEMNLKGAPADWQGHFRQKGIHWHLTPLDDLCGTASDVGFFHDRCEACVRAWLSTCEILLSWRWKAQQTSSSFHVLFHCMGGVNRSPAAACARLLLLHDVDVKDVISWVFEERKHLRPWRKRDYVLWALIVWQKHRAELWQYFNSRFVSC